MSELSIPDGHTVVRPLQQQGHYTVVHDTIFDIVMPYCPANAFKVLMLIIRKTIGWKKDYDQLSRSQIKEGTGIKSDDGLTNALKWLNDKKLILKYDEHGRVIKRSASTSGANFAINPNFEMVVPSPKNGEAATPENGDTRNRQEEPFGKSDDLPAVDESDDSSPPDNVKPISPGQYGVQTLKDKVTEARRKGWDLYDPPNVGNYGRFYANRFEMFDTDTLDLALDYIVHKAAGQIDGEPKAWCGFDTALDAVRGGWRPLSDVKSRYKDYTHGAEDREMSEEEKERRGQMAELEREDKRQKMIQMARYYLEQGREPEDIPEAYHPFIEEARKIWEQEAE